MTCKIGMWTFDTVMVIVVCKGDGEGI